MSFVWKKVDEKLKKEISKEAKKILDDFSKSLEGIEDKKLLSAVERDKQTRNETKIKCDKEFRKLFLENVPEKEEGFVLAEKKKW
jgi:predicted Asp-tRNA(Asn)/Glu-tRNA(Gln) amidotransferase subunit C